MVSLSLSLIDHATEATQDREGSVIHIDGLDGILDLEQAALRREGVHAAIVLAPVTRSMQSSCVSAGPQRRRHPQALPGDKKDSYAKGFAPPRGERSRLEMAVLRTVSETWLAAAAREEPSVREKSSRCARERAGRSGVGRSSGVAFKLCDQRGRWRDRCSRSTL